MGEVTSFVTGTTASLVRAASLEISGQGAAPTCCILGDSVSGYQYNSIATQAAASFTARIDAGGAPNAAPGNILTVTAQASGMITAGTLTGTGVSGSPQVLSLNSGTWGSVNATYVISGSAQNVTSFANGSTPAVAGNGTTTYVSNPFNPVLDGCVLNLTAPGAPFDQQQVVASSINVNGYSFPSTLNGSANVTAMYNSFAYSERGYITWANMIGGQKFRILNNSSFANGGFGGNTTAQMLARINQIIAVAPQICFVMGGINDAAQAISPTTTIANLISIYQALIAANIVPVALTILPVHNLYPDGTGSGFASTTKALLATNNLIKNYCLANGIPCIDTFSVLVDTAQTDGRGVAAYYNTAAGDYVHPTCRSARLLGSAINTYFSRIQSQQAVYLTCSGSDNYGTDNRNFNILDQAPWVNTTGGTVTAPNTGTLPPNFSVSRIAGAGGADSFVWSIVARTTGTDGDALGFNVQGVLQPSASATVQLLCGIDATSRMVAAGMYQFRCTLRLSNVANCTLFRITSSFLINDAGAVRTGYAGFMTDASVADANQWADGTYTFVTAPFRCPSWAASGAQMALLFQFSASAGAAVTVNIGRITLMRLS